MASVNDLPDKASKKRFVKPKTIWFTAAQWRKIEAVERRGKSGCDWIRMLIDDCPNDDGLSNNEIAS